MEGNREPVRLVAHPLQQVQALGGPGQDDRLRLARQPDLLESLRQAAQGDILDTELVQRLLRRRHLRSAAIDDHEVRWVRELARSAVPRLYRPPARVGYAAGVGVGVRLGLRWGCALGQRVADTGADIGQRPDRLLLLQVAAEPAGDDLVNRGHVVLPVDATDREPAVLTLAGQAVLEHHHRRDDVGALQVGHVEAFDPQWRRLNAQRVLDLLQRHAAGG